MLFSQKKAEKPLESAEVTDIREDEILPREGASLVRMELILPQIGGDVPRRAAQKINEYYQFLAGRLKQYAKGTLLREAKADYGRRQGEENPYWEPYELRAAYTVTRNEKGVLSLRCEVCRSDGGGQTDRVCYGDTWCLADGLPQPVKLPRRREAIKRIQGEAARREAQRPGLFLPHARAALRRYYDPRNSYLTPEGSVVFYPCHTVARWGEAPEFTF